MSRPGRAAGDTDRGEGSTDHAEVRLLGEGECLVRHPPSDRELRTSRSPTFGGQGTSFSSTDLVAAALGSCIATNVEPVAARRDVPLADVVVRVRKELATDPRRLSALRVVVEIAGSPAPRTLTTIRRAADACVVHRSLSPDVDVSIEVRAAG